MENYYRFYALLSQISHPGEKQDLKEELVSQYTEGRTTSLREMAPEEYSKMCQAMVGRIGRDVTLKRQRSTTLHLLQKMGIDTTDWTRVNAFCQDKRIAGKAFYDITPDEHQQLQRKLRSIESKGGLNPIEKNKSSNFQISLLCIPKMNSKNN